MLFRFLGSVRKKPKEVRDQYAFWIALFVTATVTVFWFFGLPERLTFEQSEVKSEPIFSSFFNDASKKLGEATEGIDELGTLLSSSSSTSTAPIDLSFIENGTTPAVPSTSPAAPRTIRIATTSASTTQ